MVSNDHLTLEQVQVRRNSTPCQNPGCTIVSTENDHDLAKKNRMKSRQTRRCYRSHNNVGRFIN